MGNVNYVCLNDSTATIDGVKKAKLFAFDTTKGHHIYYDNTATPVLKHILTASSANALVNVMASIPMADDGWWGLGAAKGRLTFEDETIDTATLRDANLVLYTEAAAAAGPLLDFYQNSASPAISDIVGAINFYGKNNAAAKVLYGMIDVQIGTPSHPAEGVLRLHGSSMGGGLPTLCAQTHGEDFKVWHNLLINDAHAAGMGAGRGRLVFNDETVDDITVTDANLILSLAFLPHLYTGTSSPTLTEGELAIWKDTTNVCTPLFYLLYLDATATIKRVQLTDPA